MLKSCTDLLTIQLVNLDHMCAQKALMVYKTSHCFNSLMSGIGSECTTCWMLLANFLTLGIRQTAAFDNQSPGGAGRACSVLRVYGTSAKVRL